MRTHGRGIRGFGLIDRLEDKKSRVELVDSFDRQVRSIRSEQAEVKPRLRKLHREAAFLRRVGQGRTERRELEMARLPIVVDGMPTEPRADGHAVLRPVHAEAVD